MKRWPPWRKRGVVAAIVAEAVASEGGGAATTTPMEDLVSALLVPGAALSYVLADQRRPRRLRWHLDEIPGGEVVAAIVVVEEPQA